MEFTKKELEYIKFALQDFLGTLQFLRGFTEETDKEKFTKKLIEKISNQLHND